MGLFSRSGSAGHARGKYERGTSTAHMRSSTMLLLKMQALAEEQKLGQRVFVQDILDEVIRDGLKVRQERLGIRG